MSAPSVRVEIAFTTPTLTVPGAWTDVSAYVRGISIRRGRDHELGESQAGECSIRLRNTDRRFDPTNTAGAYYPNLLPMRQIRVVATLDAVDYPLFYGYVEDWGQTWPSRPVAGAGDAECVVSAADGFKVLSLYQLRNTYAQEVLADGPIGYWKLDERNGELTLKDSSATGISAALTGLTERTDADPHDLDLMNPASFTTGVTMGAIPGPLLGGTGVMDCSGPTGEVSGNTGASSGDYESYVNVNVFLNPVVEFWVKPRSFVSGRIYCAFRDSGGISAFVIRNNGTGGRIEWAQWSGGSVVHQPLFTLTLNVWTHVVAVHDFSTIYWYVNGVLVESGALSGGGAAHSIFTTPPRMYIGGDRNSSSQPNAQIDHVAIYDQAFTSPGFALNKFSPARIAAHYAARYGSIAEGTAGEQTTLVLDMVGWPAGLRTIDTSETRMQGFDPVGSALEHLLRICEQSERGLIQMDGAGKVVFHSRDSLELTTGSHGVSQATFGDGGGAELPYADLALRYDDQDLWGRVVVTRDGGAPQMQTDAASIAAYGPRTLDVSAGSLTTDGQADAIARFLLQSYRVPTVRPVSVRLVLGSDSTYNAAVLARETHHDRVTVTRAPPGGGTPLSLVSHVEGVTWEITPGQPFECELALVPDNGVTIVSDGCVGGTLPVAAVPCGAVFSFAVAALTTSTTLVSSAFGTEPMGSTWWIFVISQKATTPDIPTLAGTNWANMTFTQRGTWLSASGLRRITLFSGTVTNATTSGVFTATFGAAQTGGAMYALESHAGTGGLATEVPAQIVHATGSSTAPLATLAATAVGSESVGALSSANTTGTITAGTGYTANSQVAAASGATGVERRTAHDAATAVGWTTSLSGAWQAVALEIATSVPAVAGVLPSLNGVTEVSSGAGAVAQPYGTALDRAGVVSLETGTTATGRSALIGAADVIQLGALELFARMSVRLRQGLGTAAQDFTVRSGAGDSATGESTDFVGFRYNYAVNGGKWQAVCRSNGTETAADTGVAPAIATWYDLGFTVNVAGTSVEFEINGMIVATITTNIPTGAARRLTFLPAFILKAAGTTTYDVLLDAYAYVMGP